MGSHYVTQTRLKLLGSSIVPPQPPKKGWLQAWPLHETEWWLTWITPWESAMENNSSPWSVGYGHRKVHLGEASNWRVQKCVTHKGKVALPLIHPFIQWKAVSPPVVKALCSYLKNRQNPCLSGICSHVLGRVFLNWILVCLLSLDVIVIISALVCFFILEDNCRFGI
jgi:hypothetical protein